MAGNSIAMKSGDILFVQSERPKEIYMLERGTVEILAASEEYNGLDRSIIVSKSRRVGTINGPALLSGFSPGLTDPYRMSARLISDAAVAKYPLPSGGMKGLASSDPTQALNFLRHLQNNIRFVQSGFERAAKLYRTVRVIADNMAIVYRELSGSNAPDRLHLEAEKIHKSFTSHGGSLPSSIDARFFITDHGAFLGREYMLPESIRDVGSRNDDFIQRTLNLEQGVVVSMFKADPSLAASIYDGLADTFFKTINRIEQLEGYIDNELLHIFGDAESWTAYLMDFGGMQEWEGSGRCGQDFVKNLLTVIVKLNQLYEDLTGRKLTALFPSIRKIHEYYKSGASNSIAAQKEAPPVISRDALHGSIQQIFEFTLMPKDFRTRFLKLLNEFKNSKNPFNTEIEGRKLRRQITTFYWDLYKQAYIRSKSESSVPRAVQLMLSFGFLDEGLLEEQQVRDLMELIRLREKSVDVPVLMETEFLDMIYEGKVEPSITEMGLTFEGYKEELDKRRNKKEREEAEKVDKAVAKVMYEIDQRTALTSAICSGATATAFPILTALMVRGNLRQMYLHKRTIEQLVKEIREIDFSLFYRETVLKLGEAREIIQEEVIPFFIILPVFGSRTQLWQVMTGTNKRSRGRIVLPVFFMGDLKRSLVHTFACFRWELARDVKGAQWADPVEGGITGEYFDYVNNYKKMSKLSQETKEKVEERFRSIRNNRDRFAEDYVQWVLFEKDGIMKLNNVVREIFFRHIPFREAIRKKLEEMPAFSQVANRYKNVHKRDVEALERKFKKYQDATGNYPEEIRKYFEFLNM